MKTLLSAIAVCLTLAGPATAQDAVVPDDFDRIRDAVDDATDRDGDGVVEILVRGGTYREDVRIRRSNVTLRGEGSATTTIDASGDEEAIRIDRVAGIEISGFTIRGAIDEGISVKRSTDVRLVANVITDTDDGIRMDRCADVHVEDNLLVDNAGTGMRITRSRGVVVTGNETSFNGDSGIVLDRANEVTIEGNESADNDDDGIRVRRSDDVSLLGNRCRRNDDDGIALRDTADAWLLDNRTERNRDNGLRMRETRRTLVSGNAFTDNRDWGIRRRDSRRDDFDDDRGGDQSPPGANDVSGNRRGAIRND